MVKIWINKQVKDEVSEDFTDSLIVNILDKNKKSNVTADVQDLWRRFGRASLEHINEDLLIIAMSVFCVDKRIPRNYFKDSWTRTISVNIPVIEINKWNAVKESLVKMLSFLTGDIWYVSFRQTTNKFRGGKKSKYKLVSNKDFNAVSLFSGGLDSFCGALKLLSEKKNTCFVGFREYSLLGKRQQELFNVLDSYYDDINKEMLLFNVIPRKPINMPEQMAKYGTESTTRSRSLLFLAGALAVASIIGKDIPVYIPENGFIGINVPLTDSRSGTCSTRTTHPYFMDLFNDLLETIGINNQIINFYSSFTKGEIVEEFADVPIFKEYAKSTISCSHPCLCRYDRIEPPKNCGYCYPCLIRKAAMNKINYDEDSYYNPNYSLTKNFISMYDNPDGKASDLRAMLLSLKNFLENQGDENYLNYILLKHGMLSKNELDSYRRVYIESMKEIFEMIQVESQRNNGDLIEYLGIDEDKREVVKQ